MEISRRHFIRTIGIISISADKVWAKSKKSSSPVSERIDKDKPEASKIRVAQIKVRPDKGKLQANHEKLFSVLDDVAKNEDIDVVVTPECFLDGYVSTEESVTKESIAKYAINPLSSKYTKAISSWACKNQVWFIFGCTRKAEDGIFNTALIYSRSGALAGAYDKLHLQTHDHKYTPGKHLHIYESDFGLFGVMICADRRWPETARTLALQGARVIFNPTYGMHNDLNLCIIRTRSYENGIFIVFTHPQQSLITGPGGDIICNNEDVKKTYTVTEIALSEAPSNRGGHIVDRRPDVYKL